MAITGRNLPPSKRGADPRKMMLQKLMAEGGRTLSDADRASVQEVMGASGAAGSGAMGASGRDMSDTDRAVMEALSGGVKRDGMDVPASDEEALMELLLQRKAKDRAMEVDAMKSGARGFAKGGAVKKAKRSMGKKSRNGCVMAGRGGKYKGTK